MPTNYTAGDHTYGSPTILDWKQGAVCTVGNYCSIATGVTILLGGEHRTDTIATYPFFENDGIKSCDPNGYAKGDVVIGSDVWIGHRATILSGVNIGDGAVIGAGSLVAGDVPPYAIVAGNPARILRYRFTDEQIEQLLEVKWWDWDCQRVARNAHLLSGTDIGAFLREAIA